ARRNEIEERGIRGQPHCPGKEEARTCESNSHWSQRIATRRSFRRSVSRRIEGFDSALQEVARRVALLCASGRACNESRAQPIAQGHRAGGRTCHRDDYSTRGRAQG